MSFIVLGMESRASVCLDKCCTTQLDSSPCWARLNQKPHKKVGIQLGQCTACLARVVLGKGRKAGTEGGNRSALCCLGLQQTVRNRARVHIQEVFLSLYLPSLSELETALWLQCHRLWEKDSFGCQDVFIEIKSTVTLLPSHLCTIDLKCLLHIVHRQSIPLQLK